jgi:hypothetical protein
MMSLILVAGFQAGAFQDDEALVCTDPVRLEIGAGQVETLQILLVDADHIYGIDLMATFNPAVVEVVDVDGGQTGVQMGPGGFLKPDFTVHNLADNAAGTLRYVVTQLNPTPPASGKGVVLSIRFRGKSPGTSSKLIITSAVIADRRGNKQPLTTQGADLIVVAPKPVTPTPRPTSTFISIPTALKATSTQAGSQPTEQPFTNVTLDNATLQPAVLPGPGDPLVESEATIIENIPARLPGTSSPVPELVLTYVTVGGFSGAFLLFCLAAGLLVVKRRRGRSWKSK